MASADNPQPPTPTKWIQPFPPFSNLSGPRFSFSLSVHFFETDLLPLVSLEAWAYAPTLWVVDQSGVLLRRIWKWGFVFSRKWREFDGISAGKFIGRDFPGQVTAIRTGWVMGGKEIKFIGPTESFSRPIYGRRYCDGLNWAWFRLGYPIGPLNLICSYSVNAFYEWLCICLRCVCYVFKFGLYLQEILVRSYDIVTRQCKIIIKWERLVNSKQYHFSKKETFDFLKFFFSFKKIKMMSIHYSY